MEIQKIVDIFKRCELFNHLTDDELNSIAKMGKIEEYDAGEEIFRQGNVGTKLYVLSKGNISLYRKIEMGHDRKGLVTVYEAREKPNRRLLGSWSALIGERHVLMCTARCEKASIVISISTDDFREVLKTDIELRVKILEKLIILLRDRLESSYSALQTL